jgi:hypothetical protein
MLDETADRIGERAVQLVTRGGVDTEERALGLLDRYLAQQGVADRPSVTPAVIDAFLASRPRAHPRSYNHLLGVLRRRFEWMVAQEMLDHSPVRLRARRETPRRVPYLFDLPQARQLLDAAATLGDTRNATARPDLHDDLRLALQGLDGDLGVDLGRRRRSVADVIADRLEREAGIDQALDAGVPQRVRAGAAYRDASLVQVVAGPARHRLEGERALRRKITEEQVPVVGLRSRCCGRHREQ